MYAFHELSSDSLETVLRNGLVRTMRGKKGDDSSTVRADSFLDEMRPQSVKDAGVSRTKNIYAYVVVDGMVLKITDGKALTIREFINQSSDAIIEITIEPSKCFVSDLDAFDELRAALKKNLPHTHLVELAANYWERLLPLKEFSPDKIERPEIMITYDIMPQAIRIVKG